MEENKAEESEESSHSKYTSEKSEDTLDVSKEELRERIRELENENEKLRTFVSRKEDIIDETKRKNRSKIDEIEKSLTQEFVKDISDIRLSLTKAIEKSEDDCKVRSGLSTTLQSIEQILENKGVKIVDPEKGNNFNPDLHKAIGTRESEDMESDKILDVHREGYLYKGKVLQYAKVTVTS